MRESAHAGVAPTSRYVATTRRIVRCAQRLADERGLDGFTMDELAREVGVARRTLFNHVPSKIDAVLGPVPTGDPDPIAVFRAGGPSGDPVADLHAVGADLLRLRGWDVDDLLLLRRLLGADARLLQAVHERLERAVERLGDAIMEREGAGFDPFAARVFARMSLCALHLAIQEFLAHPEVPAADHYLRTLRVAADMFP
ncbi:MAG TPA: helix-turn-helix domain-containing protein [Miltoncostaeaceae bacterium]|nr:helix-turn-helix domain-containing protein [Miltoncostaeaceae bacterium]